MKMKSPTEVAQDFESWFKKEESDLVKVFGAEMTKNFELFSETAYYQGVLDTIKQ